MPNTEWGMSNDGEGTASAASSLSHSVSVASYVASLAEAGLPLEAGLRAFSEEAPSPRLRRTLRRMSRELQRGLPPDEVLSRPGRGMPSYLRGLVRAGIQLGRLGSVLEEFLRAMRERRDLRLRYWVALVYPLLLLPLVLSVGMFLLLWIVPQFKDLFMDFGVELPEITIAVIEIGDALVFLAVHWLQMLVVVAPLIAFLVGLRWLPGRAMRVRLWQRIPFVGTPSLMRGLSEFCSLLGLLVAGRIPLPEALRLTAGAMDDPNLSQGTRRLASRIEQGEAMDDAARALPHFPPTLVNLFRWSDREQAFGDALRTASALYAARARVQAGMAGMFFQPFLLVVAGGFIGFVVIALFMPLMKLLNELS